MRVDLETHRTEIETLPRFQQAQVHVRQLRRLTVGLGVVAGGWFLAARVTARVAADSMWLPLLGNLCAALLVLVAATLSAWQVAAWRAAALKPSPPAQTDEPQTSDPGTDPQAAVPLHAAAKLAKDLRLARRKLAQRMGVGAIWRPLLALLSLRMIESGWNLQLAAGPVGNVASAVACVALVLAFGLMVVERHLIANGPLEWPEAASLGMQIRVTMACLVLAALCLFFAGAGAVWPQRLAVLIGVLPAAVAIEQLLRAMLSLFAPPRDALEPKFIAESFVAQMLRWPPRPLQILQDELQQRFGIDLRQSWAFGFIRRASLPVLALIAALGWLLSGINEIPIDRRGVYERFGKPVEVFAPGMHLTVPWPFGTVRLVDNGVIHQLVTASDSAPIEDESTAEGPAPANARRLWDASHPSEKSQVIASVAGGKESFQVVNMDVRLIYRIGLNDRAALAAIYNTNDVPGLIRSTADRVLVHDFAARSLDGLLGDDRRRLAIDIGTAVQAELDRVDSGVEILATLVEAIHPPAGAANAYHAVQAAQITAKAQIARERGKAAEVVNQAKLDASVKTDNARASAYEVDATAQASGLRFSADRQAWRRAGQAFLTERYYSQLDQGLSHAKVLIIDHRIAANVSPTLDFRSFAVPVDAASRANKSSQEKTR